MYHANPFKVAKVTNSTTLVGATYYICSHNDLESLAPLFSQIQTILGFRSMIPQSRRNPRRGHPVKTSLCSQTIKTGYVGIPHIHSDNRPCTEYKLRRRKSLDNEENPPRVTAELETIDSIMTESNE